MNSVFFVAILGTLVLVAQTESVEKRVKAAFKLLPGTCRTNVRNMRDKCQYTERLKDIRNYSDRAKACSKYQNERNGHLICLQYASCKKDDIKSFFRKLCDFDLYNSIRGSKGLMLKFSTKCRPQFNSCTYSTRTNEMLKREDFCAAFKKDGELEECFEDKKKCDNDADEDNFDRIQHKVCGGSAGVVYSLLLMITCLFMGRPHL